MIGLHHINLIYYNNHYFHNHHYQNVEFLSSFSFIASMIDFLGYSCLSIRILVSLRSLCFVYTRKRIFRPSLNVIENFSAVH